MLDGVDVPYVSLGPGLDPSAIADGERRLGLAIPEAYKALLARTNGARLEDVVFDLLVVSVLAGMKPPGSGVDPADLVGWHAYFAKGKLGPPKGAFRFASSPAGDFVVFAEGRARGEVHYVDREHRRRRRVASSMEAFLGGLRRREPIAPTYVSALRPAASTRKTRTRVPRGFTVVQGLELEGPVCRQRLVAKTVVRDVVVEGATIRVKTGARNVASLVNCLFDRVVVRGDVRGGVFVRTDPFGLSPADVRALATFYDGVEWALDLREARFSNLTLRGVPGHLVRRDPERLVLLRSDRLAEDRRWRRWDKGLVAVLDYALASPGDWHFHSADDLSPKARERRAELRRLREHGFGE